MIDSDMLRDWERRVRMVSRALQELPEASKASDELSRLAREIDIAELDMLMESIRRAGI